MSLRKEKNRQKARYVLIGVEKDSILKDMEAKTLVRLVRSGAEYFELLDQLLTKARHDIYFQTYIFQDDETGQRVARALTEASLRGIKVYLLVDGYASQDLPDSFIKYLQNAGVHFRFFDPLLKSKYFYFGRRLHHKVVVVDGTQALVGGINVSNHYNDTTEGAAWLDWALYVEGNVAKKLEWICQKRASGNFASRFFRKKAPHGADVSGLVHVRVNDWVRRRREITNTYLSMFRQAKSHITILSSYFLPGKLLRKSISLAAQRGIKIKLIVAGVSDVKVAKYAERYMYRWLLRNNVEIYEYQRNVLHGKMGVCDSHWLTLGSYNINNISAYASIELNLDVHYPGIAQQAEERLGKIMEKDCIQITNERYAHISSLYQQFLQRSAYDIFRVGLFLFTFYFKQRE